MQEIQFVKQEGQSSPGGSGGEEKKSPSGNGKRSWIAVAVILLAAVICAGILQYSLITETQVNYGGGDPYIGVLYVEGTIQSSESATSKDSYQHDWELARVDELMKDDKNEGLLLYVNSPGGSVYQSDELYLKLREYKERTGRPFYVYFGETAASGAYYISADADYICANRNTLTGSIGVYMGPLISAEKLLEKLGVEADIVKSGANKAIGSGYEDVTEEQKAIYQAVVDEMSGRFVSIVAEGRGMSEARIRQLGDGRVYTAQQAVENGLVDRVCTYDEAVSLMSQKESLDCKVVRIRYTPPNDLLSSLFGLQETAERLSSGESASEAESVLRLLEEYSEPQFLYMMQ